MYVSQTPLIPLGHKYTKQHTQPASSAGTNRHFPNIFIFLFCTSPRKLNFADSIPLHHLLHPRSIFPCLCNHGRVSRLQQAGEPYSKPWRAQEGSARLVPQETAQDGWWAWRRECLLDQACRWNQGNLLVEWVLSTTATKAISRKARKSCILPYAHLYPNFHG